LGQVVFSASAARTLSPSSPVTVPEYVERRIEESTVESLREAVQLSSTNAAAFARLAMAVAAQSPSENPRRTVESDWLSRRAVELSPDNPKVWRLERKRRLGCHFPP
jgi:hypothetical protein